MLPNLLFLYDLLNELGYRLEPAIIFEDNMALIDLLKRGKVSSGVTKHISAKYYYSKDLIRRNIIQFKYCPTELMIPDILTKPLSRIQFIKLKNILHNHGNDESTLEVYRKLYRDELKKGKDKLIQRIIVNALRMMLK